MTFHFPTYYGRGGFAVVLSGLDFATSPSGKVLVPGKKDFVFLVRMVFGTTSRRFNTSVSEVRTASF